MRKGKRLNRHCWLLSRGNVFLRHNFNDSVDTLLVFQCLSPQDFVFDGERYLLSEFS